MKKGYFNSRGELFFEMDLMMIDSSIVTVDALLDTGFTDWLAMNVQDIEDLGWPFLDKLDSRQKFLRAKTFASNSKRLTDWLNLVFMPVPFFLRNKNSRLKSLVVIDSLTL